jgi:hypothetical protein
LDNTELAEAASRALGAHLEMTSLSLFSRASESFEYEVVSDGRDEILRITGMMIKGPSKNAKPQFLQIDGVELPVNKNFFRLDGEKQEIYGVVVKTVNGEGEAEYYVPKRLNICIQMGSCPDQFSFGPVEMKAD